MKKLGKILFLIFVLFLLTPILVSAQRKYDTDKKQQDPNRGNTTVDMTIGADFFHPVFNINLNEGYGIFGNEYDKRLDYNYRLAKGELGQHISLYDRFGGDISFIPYFGEKKFIASVMDKYYSGYRAGEGLNIQLSDLWTVFVSDDNHMVYKNRPDIVDEIDFMDGYYDPRRWQYENRGGTGSDASVGNFWLHISSASTRLIMYLTSNEFLNSAKKIFDEMVKTDEWKYVQKLGNFILSFLAVVSVFKFIPLFIKYFKGHRSGKYLIQRYLNIVLAFAIVTFAFNSPTIFSSTTIKIFTYVDSLFNNILKVPDDPVSYSSDDTYVLTARVWKITTLDPWAKGMFDGKSFNMLYTQYSNEGLKLPQSDDNIYSSFKDEERYNSKVHTGDIQIPLGAGKFTRNWGALAWSTQSSYHLDAVVGDIEDPFAPLKLHSKRKANAFPLAQTTPRNNNIYVDNFRWLDAKLNISPMYTSPTETKSNYQRSRAYSSNFTVFGLEAFYKAMLLIPLIPIIFRRILVMLYSLFFMLIWVKRTFMYALNPENNEYAPLRNFSKLLKSWYHYFWWSLILYISISLYIALAPGNLLANIAWLFLSIMIWKNSKPIDSFDQIRGLKRDFSNRIRKIKNNFRERSAKRTGSKSKFKKVASRK